MQRNACAKGHLAVRRDTCAKGHLCEGTPVQKDTCVKGHLAIALRKALRKPAISLT